MARVLLLLALVYGLTICILSAPGWLPLPAFAEANSHVSADTSPSGSLAAALTRRAALPFLPRGLTSEAEESPAIARANAYRSLAGLDLLQSHPSIESAAQNHADYYLLNHADPGAGVYGAHGEVQGKPAYTGRWPSDRLAATDYPWTGGAEVMHFIADPVASVDDWMSGIYHRVLILDPSARYAGYGSGTAGSVAVDIMDLGSGPWELASDPDAPYPLAYPADGQAAVPTSWNGAEWPDPLPDGASRPVGYPFTLQGANGTLSIDWVEMRDSADAAVEVHPSPTECEMFNCYALIPVSPLQPGAIYTVHAQGVVRDVPFNWAWQFTTE